MIGKEERKGTERKKGKKGVHLIGKGGCHKDIGVCKGVTVRKIHHHSLQIKYYLGIVPLFDMTHLFS